MPTRRTALLVAPAAAAAVVAVVVGASTRTPPVRAGAVPHGTSDGGDDSGDPVSLAAGVDLVGTKMPPLAFERWVNTGGGKPLDTSGRVTLYRWWTDGCPHCEKTLPAIEALRAKYGPEGLRVVAVYHPKPVREVDDGDVWAAANRMGFAGAVAIDLDWSELKKFYLGTGNRPATSASFLVDPGGTIRLVHPGPRFYASDDPGDAKEDGDYRRVEAAVKALVGAKR